MCKKLEFAETIKWCHVWNRIVYHKNKLLSGYYKYLTGNEHFTKALHYESFIVIANELNIGLLTHW